MTLSLPSAFRRAAAGTLAALFVGATPARAEHFYASWLQEYDRTSQLGQTASAVAVDHRGNVITAGCAPSDAGYSQCYVAKYDGLDGHLLWERFFGVTQGDATLGTPTQHCYARALAVDSHDNILVTGGAYLAGSQEDFLTIKYDPDGGTTWVKSFNTAGIDSTDEARKVVLDKDDNVIVTGVSFGGESNDDFVTIKYKPDGSTFFSNGFQRYARTVGGINCIDTPTGLAVDKTGNIWVTGRSDLNGTISFVTIEYDATGALGFPALVHTSAGAGDGAKAVAVNSLGDAVVTGNEVDGANHDGYYTVQYRHGDGQVMWQDSYTLGHADFDGGATSVGVDANDDVYITGAIVGANGIATAVTIKYDGASLTTGRRKWLTSDTGLSAIGKVDPNKNLPIYDTLPHQLIIDGAGQVVIVGDTVSKDGDADVYFAKLDATDGHRLYAAGYGGDYGGPDTGVAATVDAGGNVAIVGTEKFAFIGGTVGYNAIATLKFQRILAAPGDDLPPNPVSKAARKVSVLNAPALADNGDLAARITLAEGKTKLTAVLTQGGAGGSQLPAIQKGPANVPGSANATFSSFTDPVVSPDGHYAFLAKLAGVPPANVSSLWTNLGGTLHLALQQGKPVPNNPMLTVSSIASIAMRDSQLVALVKLAGPAATNLALIGLDAANTGTVLLRTGAQNGLMLNSVYPAIKSLSVLSPTTTSPGDGRAQGDDHVVAKAVLADKARSTVIFNVTSAGVATAPLYTGIDASEVLTSATFKTFGLPAVAPTGGANAVLGTLNVMSGVTTASDTAIVVAASGNTYAMAAREGDPVQATTNLPDLSYSALSDPVIDSDGAVAFLATLKGTTSATKVATTVNRVLLYGAAGAPKKVARTGDQSPDSGGTANGPVFSAFTAFALPDAGTGGPIFVAKLGAGSTAKTNIGVWGVDSHHTLRKLLRTGDALGTQVVSSITLLKATPQAFTATRSYNANGSVVILVGFADKTTGLVEIALP